MTSATDVGRVGGLLDALERRKKSALGVDRLTARRALARELRCAPGTLTNIVKGRVKGVKDHLRDRIEEALLRTIRGELVRLQDEEAAILAGSPRRARERDLAEIEEDVARLRAALRQEPQA